MTCKCDDIDNMTDKEFEEIRRIHRLKILSAYISKENGEIVKSLYIDEDDHWKEELGDMCYLTIKPMLEIAGMTFEQACELGEKRRGEKIRRDTLNVVVDGYLKGE